MIIIIIESELNRDLQSRCLELCQPRPTGHGSSASAGPRRRSPVPLRPGSRRDHRGHPMIRARARRRRPPARQLLAWLECNGPGCLGLTESGSLQASQLVVTACK